MDLPTAMLERLRMSTGHIPTLACTYLPCNTLLHARDYISMQETAS